MKNLVKISMLIGVLFMVSLYEMNAQITPESSVENIEYDDLGKALENPNKVYRLNLSNQNLKTLSDTIWSQFENLEYLSLKNDHLTEIPAGIGNLKNLKVLDLSNNDFKVLPQSFSRLENLREIYLNDEKEIDLNQSLIAIKNLPNLRILHLENDNLENIPPSLLEFTQLEKLYLNKNSFNKIPNELKNLNNIKFIDFHDNKFNLNDHNFESPFLGPGILINL